MKVQVFDTYVRKDNGGMMHFDIIVPEGTQAGKVFQFGNDYLKTKGVIGSLDTSMCQFCHVEHLQRFMEDDIRQKGYFILEMQGC